jgi:hypothetical protein
VIEYKTSGSKGFSDSLTNKKRKNPTWARGDLFMHPIWYVVIALLWAFLGYSAGAYGLRDRLRKSNERKAALQAELEEAIQIRKNVMSDLIRGKKKEGSDPFENSALYQYYGDDARNDLFGWLHYHSSLNGGKYLPFDLALVNTSERELLGYLERYNKIASAGRWLENMRNAENPDFLKYAKWFDEERAGLGLDLAFFGTSQDEFGRLRKTYNEAEAKRMLASIRSGAEAILAHYDAMSKALEETDHPDIGLFAEDEEIIVSLKEYQHFLDSHKVTEVKKPEE